MVRRKKHRGDAVDGLLLLDKPAGMTSNRALQTVRRLLNAAKAGHTGSLDPAATGMLPLCFGEATKVCAYLLDADKSYRVVARLGSATDTGDAEGREIETAPVPVMAASDWDRLLQEFVGESMQVPPMYSALKKDGKRLYELARRGETVEREPRRIQIGEIQLLEATDRRLVFRVTCSKGTYVRTLVEDIGKRAGTVAHTASLHRESVGPFRSEDMVDLGAVEAWAGQDMAALRAGLLRADEALQGLPEIRVDAGDMARYRDGQAVCSGRETALGLVRVYGPDDEFLGVGERVPGDRLVPRRVFKTEEKTP